MPGRLRRPRFRRRPAAFAAAASIAVASVACNGDSATGPREVVIPEGAVFTATVDRAEIVRGSTATITYRLTNPRDTAITIPVEQQNCRLYMLIDAQGRDFDGACIAPGGDLVIAAHESFAVTAPFTARRALGDGTVIDYPSGLYEVRAYIERFSYDPFEARPRSPLISVIVRDR